MFPKSLQWRLVSFFCLITFCLIIPIGLYLNSKVENQYYTKFIEGIDKGFKNWTIDYSNPPAGKELVKELEDSVGLFFANLPNRSYIITDKNGNIITDLNGKLGTNDIEVMSNPQAALNILLNSDNFVEAMRGKEGNRKLLEHYGDQSYFDYAKPIGDNIIYFRYNRKDWVDLISEFSRIIFTCVILALVTAFIAGYLLSKTITAPLVKLMHRANSIAGGDFGQVLEVQSSDEIGNLTKTFNYMAANLKDNLTEISSEKSKMETILNYMTDGVIAFNLQGEMIHTNPASARLLCLEGEIINFQEYCTRYGFKYNLEDVIYLQSKSTSEMNIDINGKTIKVYFAVFTDELKKPEGVIAVLQDITEQQRLENMRKEFVANVSHELRTPLTSIKSYAETLLDGALDDRETSEKFLGVINAEADRMTHLVKDLLQLSRLDNQQLKWNFEEVSLVELVKSAVERMEMEAMARHQTLNCYVMGDIPLIEADYGRLEQVVFNIVGNAIKYTPDDGKVTVYIGKIYSEVYFKVADTGIGIPENDLPRIFERFYRVDKARSREMGGTGLGLAIAKEIVEAHGGAVAITSQVGQGTEVTVRMPIIHTDLEKLRL
jgi:two-component system, OmpR family, sensor histidine kinase VicK